MEVHGVTANVGRALRLLHLPKLEEKRVYHGLGGVGLVVVPGLAQRGFNNVTVVVVKHDVVFEYVRGGLGGEDVVYDELAVGGEEVPPLVQLLDLDVVVLGLVVQVDEDVLLDERVHQVAEVAVGP